MDQDMDYEAEALSCLETASEFPDADSQRTNWTLRAQVYATLHLASVLTPAKITMVPFDRSPSEILDRLIAQQGGLISDSSPAWVAVGDPEFHEHDTGSASGGVLQHKHASGDRPHQHRGIFTEYFD